MTTITGNARFREAVAARLVLAMRPDQSIVDTATPDAQSSPTPGDYSIQVDTHQVLLQAHAFDPAKLIGPWRSESVYAVGDVIFETSIDADALVLECTSVTGAAETGATEPSWDATPGNTTNDNEVAWATIGTVAELTPLTQWHYQAVLVSSVSPNSGSEDGGTSITITGSGFQSGATVTIGGAAATNVVIVSDTEITCDTPAGTDGAVDVVVTQASETAALSGGFEYTSTAGSWTPADITTGRWLDGNDGSTITLDGNQNIEQWGDKSGNSQHATQTISNRRPTVSPAEINGKDAIDFSASTATHMQMPSGLITGAISAYVVWSGGGSNQRIIDQRGTGPSGSVKGWQLKTYSSGTALVDEGNNNYRTKELGSLSTSSPRLTGITFEAGQGLDWWIDGVSSGTPNNGGNEPVDIGGSPDIFIAANATGIGAQSFSGSIAEIIICSEYHDASTRQKVEGYLAHKWGLQASLPSGHPYKSSPP